ncbi:Uma2 family endonuclease [Planococcus donghaensis]|uniref:Uma2 family endonuclease n=1 Tax=Planococcus donghaensis TaxID=414778 RepID=UPI0037359F6D
MEKNQETEIENGQKRNQEQEKKQEQEQVKVAVGVRLSNLRQLLKLTLAQVESMTGIPASYIHRLEKGMKQASLSTINKLAEAYQVTSEELLGVRDVELFHRKIKALEELSYPLEDRTYSYMEYTKWPGRWELIHGVPYSVDVPSMLHQRVVTRLCVALGSHLGSLHGNKGKEVFIAPFEVYLQNGDIVKQAVVQPDITVVNEQHGLCERGVRKAPELVVEVLSPVTALRDRTTKFELYKASGVEEYWIVDPVHKTIEVYTHMSADNPHLIHTTAEGILQSSYLWDFKIPLRLLFQ